MINRDCRAATRSIEADIASSIWQAENRRDSSTEREMERFISRQWRRRHRFPALDRERREETAAAAAYIDSGKLRFDRASVDLGYVHQNIHQVTSTVSMSNIQLVFDRVYPVATNFQSPALIHTHAHHTHTGPLIRYISQRVLLPPLCSYNSNNVSLQNKQIYNYFEYYIQSFFNI